MDDASTSNSTLKPTALAEQQQQQQQQGRHRVATASA